MKFKKTLNGDHANIKVIIYVRDPLSFIASNFQEDVKSGRNPAAPLPPRYRQRIQNFVDIFGFNNIIVRDFSRQKLHNSDIVEDFSKIIGVAAPRKPARGNESLSTEAVKILYILNKIVKPLEEPIAYRRARNELIDHLRHEFPGRIDMPNNLFNGVIQGDDVEWLFSTFGIDYRDNFSCDTEFSCSELSDYMNSLDSNTIESLRSYLSTICGVPNPPVNQNLLVARYFMSFLDASGSKKFKFDPELYLKLNPDVKRAGVNPYRHYLEHGIFEGRRIK